MTRTEKEARAFWREYNRLAETLNKNRTAMADADRDEKRRLIRENNEIMTAMNRMFI